MTNPTTPTLYPFHTADVRTITVNGEPLFVAKDVALALGYTNPQKAIRDHCDEPITITILDRLGRKQPTTLIPESDIYSLIFRSKLPAAEEFTDWVCKEVLPSIRKIGSYIQVKAEETEEELTLRVMSNLQAKIDETRQDIMARGILAAQEVLSRTGAKPLETVKLQLAEMGERSTVDG